MPALKNSKKGISPLIATILLIAFALIIGAVTMNWGKAYAEKSEEPNKDSPSGNGFVIDNAVMIINYDKIDSPLKELQLKYLTGRISQDEYLKEEKAIVENINPSS